jgi:hypothetical protein
LYLSSRSPNSKQEGIREITSVYIDQRLCINKQNDLGMQEKHWNDPEEEEDWKLEVIYGNKPFTSVDRHARQTKPRI